MRIVIDMQGVQTPSKDRGIGRYVKSLTENIIKYGNQHQVLLALNGAFPDTVESIRYEFGRILPQENICVWYPAYSPNEVSLKKSWWSEAAEYTREAFLASLNPDIILIGSLFEGVGNHAVTSIKAFVKDIPVAVIFYDLIPILYGDHYFNYNDDYRIWYTEKVTQLKQADLLLAISESSRQEGIEHLAFPGEKVVNISSAASSDFRPKVISETQRDDIFKRYAISRPFIMYAGGLDTRKNIEGFIRAYSLLPAALRARHQAVLVCNCNHHERMYLRDIAKQHGIKDEEIVITDFVTDMELLALYNLCKLFVLPSWHEGFGLPVLEAMSCGKAVIASNSSSLPEVIGREDAMFDAKDDKSIANKIVQVLVDEQFRHDLEEHGLHQARQFSWEKSAKRALFAMEECVSIKMPKPASLNRAVPLRLAYFSPLPPERSGISYYSAELLPELANYYQIDIIVDPNNASPIADPWIKSKCVVRDVVWFQSNYHHYDRVLYHYGNSPFHKHMFDLSKEFPGVVVLHDFFLSNVRQHLEDTGYRNDSWLPTLYDSHGYAAVWRQMQTNDIKAVTLKYPCNLDVLQRALGVIVHSENSKRLASDWYGERSVQDWTVMPLLRIPSPIVDKKSIRAHLGLDENSFVVCSFGLLAPTKLNHRLLQAWLDSELAKNKDCYLFFVGENEQGEYGKQLTETIIRSGLCDRIKITGWADAKIFNYYLSVADVAVQLRAQSRGETSAAILDCMNYGVPGIVNAHGSMMDLPDDAVYKLPDEFEDAQLREALELLWKNSQLRNTIGTTAAELIRTRHLPAKCAKQYYDAIEKYYLKHKYLTHGLCKAVTTLESAPPIESEAWENLAQCIAQTMPVNMRQKQLFVDISTLVHTDLKTGIERSVKSILWELLTNPPEGYRVEPVYASFQHGYRYARSFTAKFLGCHLPLADAPIDYGAGDYFLGLDWIARLASFHQVFYQKLRNDGVKVKFIIYDLLPLVLPKFFIEYVCLEMAEWIKVVLKSDGCICISQSVADSVKQWAHNNDIALRSTFQVDSFHLGADIENSSPTVGMSDDLPTIIAGITRCPSFLMVGTLEPRKGHTFTLDAFEMLWERGMDINLVIVGKRGWMMDQLCERLDNHQEKGRHLYWLEGISDEYLSKLYQSATCLIAASEGEGFGLPLIEAAQKNLPIVARDIAVFREVAGEYAYYFPGKEPNDLVEAIEIWLRLYGNDAHPKSTTMPWLTWKQSVSNLLKLII